MEMGRPGRKRRLVLEDEYWKLMAAGVGTGEACRRLGICRTTVTTGAPSAAGWLARCAPRTPARAVTCQCWSANASRSCACRGAACVKWLADWGGPPRRSRGNCGAKTRVGCAAASSRATRRCGQSCKRNLSCSGVPSRSLPGCGASIPGSRGGRPIAPFVDS